MGPTSRPGWLGRPLLQRLGVREAAVGLTVPDPLPAIGYDETPPVPGPAPPRQARSGRLRAAPACQPTGPATSHSVTTLSAPYAPPAGNTPLAKAIIGVPPQAVPRLGPLPPAPRRPASGRGWRATGRAPEAACKSDQQKSPISQVLEPITHRPENDKEVLTEEGLGLMLSRSVSAADAAHRRPDQRTDCRV